MIYLVSNSITLIPNEVYSTSTIDKCLEYFKDHKLIQLDTETTGFDPHSTKLLTVQLGDKYNQWVLEVASIDMQVLKPLLEDRNKTFILQNAKFDLRFFYKHNIYIQNIYDTFLVECILNTGVDEAALGLDDLAEKYCGAVLDKTIRGNIHKEGLSTRVIKYAADDVKYLETIREKQLEQVAYWELEKVVWLENEVTKVFARIEYTGISIDRNKWLEVAIVTENNTIQCIKDLDDIVLNEPKLAKWCPKYSQGNLFGFEERILTINWSSNMQKLKLLQALGLKIEDVGDRTLQKNKKAHPIVPKLIEYVKNAKLATAFGKKFLEYVNPTTGKIHYTVWQILSTGRISVSEPNLNQIPSKGELAKVIRSCFIPQDRYKIVGGDYSGMELRIIAEFSKDPLWINAFKEGKDLHSVLCAATFGIDAKDVKQETPFKKGVTYRDVQKTINFGLAYGMSKFKLADTMGISVDEADRIIKKFFAVVPKVEEFLNNLGDLGKSRGYIRTGDPFRRIRWFPKFKDSIDNTNPEAFKLQGEIERASKNTPIQGSNGDVVKLALIKTQQVIDDNNYPVNILLSVYDEIQTECEESFAEEWKGILDNIMIEAAKVVIKDVPIVVDCKISDYWEK